MKKRNKQSTFLELNLNNPASRNISGSANHQSLFDLIRVIEQAGNNKKIDGILLNISSYAADRNIMWELRKSLEKYKSKGKKLCAFISNADLDVYCLATVADTIVMDELGGLELLGYVFAKSYAKQGLDKLGIGVRELRYMEFKSAVERLSRDTMSDADKAQLSKLMEDIMTITRETICEARSLSSEEFDSIVNDEFLFKAKHALERKLVDSIGRKEAVKNSINSITGRESDNAVNFIIYGDHDSSICGSENDYKIKKLKCPLRPQIAIINANGACDLKKGIKAWSLASTIRKVSEKKRVKAIVLCVNSPGGSAEASDYVDEAIKAAKGKKPVVVSMGDVAASGGYWISMNASHICASPVTITGSIGVISSWFYDNGLYKKVGINVDSVQQGDHADMMVGALISRRDLEEGEEQRIKESILDMYSEFKNRVSESRGIELEQVEAVAKGRIHSGIDAHKFGLIDSIGGLDDAIGIARNLAEISVKKKVVYKEFPKLKWTEKMRKGLIPFATTSSAASFFIDLLLPEPILADLQFRLEHNGRIMPLMPLGDANYLRRKRFFDPDF